MEEKESNLNKFKKNFNQHFSLKKSGLFIATFILFFIFEDRFISFINSHLLIKESFSFYFLDVIILLSSVVFITLIIKKLVFDKYLPSYSEFYSSFFISIIFLEAIWNADAQNWTFHKDKIFSLCYVFYLLFPLVLFIILYVIKFSIIYFFNPFKKKKDIINEFKNDDPIFKIDQDKLGYMPIINRVTKILLKEKHEKSLSIGLVGPWGNGKSSVIDLIKKEIKNKEILKLHKSKEPIVIHFLPYLNHSEKDIINEFFISFSDKLSKYNGKLSDEITSYSQKLTDLYKSQNISGFIDSKISNIKNEPAKQLYENINNRLKEIDKKIIVFVDDLDRLNDKEILEVLKLIRNTANFHNTIFLVAMDKPYVLSRLKKNDTILNSSFVEKFFQLEIYLPEIDQTVLRNYVFDVLKNSFNELGFESKLTSAFSSNFLLFDDYVKNFRDAKRLINQVVYDYKNFGKEIDLKDFMNFIFFKLKFPKFMKLLNEDRSRFFETDIYGNYKLKPLDDPGNSDKSIKVNETKVFRHSSNIVEEYIKGYEIYKQLNIGCDKCFELTLDIDFEDKTLLLKTLVHLFGDKNQDNYHSIKKENNFRMLMQQRVFKNVLVEDDFTNLLKNDIIEDVVKKLKELHKNLKLDQLINRIEYYTSIEGKELEFEKVTLIILQLYEHKTTFKLYDAKLLMLIKEFVGVKTKDKKDEDIAWIKKNIFESKSLSLEIKTRIIGEIWKAKNENDLWGLKEDYIVRISKDLYDTYLKSKIKLWPVTDFSFYGVFYDLANIREIEGYLRGKLKSFWDDKDIELQFAQALEIDAFSATAFNISDFEKRIYGSKTEYYEYIKNHKDQDKPAVKEFLKFLYLLKVTKFEIPLKFKFNKSELVIEKLQSYVESDLNKNRRDELADIKQVIIETNNQQVFNSIKIDSDLKEYINNFYYFENGDKFHLYISYINVEHNSKISKFTKRIFDVIKEEPKWSEAIFIEKNIEKKENFIQIPNEEELYIKIISSY